MARPRVLFDLNVLLDVLLDRAPHAATSSALWALAEQRRITGVVPGHAVTTIFYIAEKNRGPSYAREVVGLTLDVFEVASVEAEGFGSTSTATNRTSTATETELANSHEREEVDPDVQ